MKTIKRCLYVAAVVAVYLWLAAFAAAMFIGAVGEW